MRCQGLDRLRGLAVGLVVPAWTVPAALVLATRSLAGGPVVAVLTGVLVLAWRAWTTDDGPVQAAVWLGTVSSAAYLWNYPLSLWLPPLPAVALTLVAAALSWRYVEPPLQRRGRVAVAT